MQRTCQHCGNAFVPKQRKSRACSSECRAILYRSEHREDAKRRTKEWTAKNEARVIAYRKTQLKGARPLTCIGCEKTFSFHGGSKKYCTPECQQLHYRKNNPHIFLALRKKHRVATNARNMLNYRKTRAKTPWKILLSAAEVRARKKGIPFSLNESWALARWTGRCELTGVPFTLGVNRREAKSPSLDQINAGEGYTPKNCRFILWALNACKGSDSEETLHSIAAALIQQHSLLPEAFLALPG